MKLRNKASNILSIFLVFILLFSNIIYAKNNDEESIINESVQQIGPGTYFKQTDIINSKEKFRINTIETTIGTNYIKIEGADNGNALGTATVSKQAEAKIQKDSRVIGAINGDFFHLSNLSGLPVGSTIIDGEIRNAVKRSSVFGVTNDGHCFIDTLKFNGQIKSGRNTFPLSGINGYRLEDNLIIYTPAFGKTTKTNAMGIEVIVKGIDLPLLANKEYKGLVSEVIEDIGGAEIPEDGVVLSAHGKAINFLKALSPGDKVTFTTNFDKGDLKYIISGIPRIIEDGEIAADIDKNSAPGGRHPRTAIGIKGGNVVLLTVDGRKKDHSDGMNLQELADYMLDQGIENAINLDGGGSTVMIARKQGNITARLANSPSDGRERAVANSIQIISDAPLSEAKTVVFERKAINIFKNSDFIASAYALDKYFNRVDVESNKLKYTASQGIGKINEDGLFTAGKRAGQGFIEATLANSKSKIEVEVFDKVASLRMFNDYFSLEPGEQIQMQVKAYDKTGREIIISPSAIDWIISKDFGTIDEAGVFTAGKNLIDGKIAAKVGDVAVSVTGRIGNLPIVLEGFENADNIEMKSIRAEASGRISKIDEPIILGNSSYKFNYNMLTEEEGTSAAYLNFKNNIKVPGKPIEIGLWVYGNGQGNWLRATYLNANGERKVIDLSKQGGFDWKGWKFAYAEIPKDEKFPIAIEQIYVAEPIEENKVKSTFYLDNLTALYKEGEDYYNPEVVDISFADNEEFEEKPEELIIKVRDKGEGIDPKSIVLLINNIQVKAEYDEKQGTITHKLTNRLFKGENKIWLRLKDKAGNRLNPEFKSTFIMNK